MDIDHVRIHRHFLGVPLFIAALVFIGTYGGGIAKTNAQVETPRQYRAIQAPVRVRTSTGVADLAEDGELRTRDGIFVLDRGTVLVASPVHAHLAVTGMRLSGYHGAFLTSTISDGSVDVFALTTPVLVARGGYRFIIPQQMRVRLLAAELPWQEDLSDVQRRLATVQPIVPDFLRGQLLKIARLPEIPVPALAAPMTMLSLDALQLPRAAQAASRTRILEQFGALQRTLRSNDMAEARAHLQTDELRRLLAARQELLPVLLADADDMPSIAEALIAELRDTDLWLLLSFHPHYRSAAWVSSGPVSTPDTPRVLRWMTLPVSDIGETSPGSVVKQWKREIQVHAKSDRSGAFLGSLLSPLEQYRAWAEKEQLPERLRQYADTVTSLEAEFLKDIPDDLRGSLRAWNDVRRIPAFPDILPSLPSSVSEQQVANSEQPTANSQQSTAISDLSGSFDAEATVRQARRMLQDSGGLFTVQTELQPVDVDTVNVSGIVYPSQSAERTYAFTLNLSTQHLSDITQDRQPLLYGLSLDAFAAWAKGQ